MKARLVLLLWAAAAAARAATAPAGGAFAARGIPNARDAALASPLFSRGSDALFGDPAGLADLEAFEAGFNHQRLLLDAYTDALSLAWPWRSLALAGGFRWTDFGRFQGYDEQGRPEQDFGATRMDSRAGLAGSLAQIRFGLGLSWLRDSLPSQDLDAWVLDLGAQWDGGRSLKLAALLNNLGLNREGAWKGELGLRKEWPGLALNGSLVWNALGYAGAAAGLEANPVKGMHLRVGYFDGLSLGLGWQTGPWGLDYAWCQGSLAPTQQLSLRFAVTKATPTPAPIEPVQAPDLEADPTPSSPTPVPIPTPPFVSPKALSPGASSDDALKIYFELDEERVVR